MAVLSHRDRASADVDGSYDVVVIGAGIGGLVASALMAREGLRVLVLEQNPSPGGCSVSIARRGWSFSVGIHYVGECGPGERVRRIVDACGAPDFRFLPLSRDLEDIRLGEDRFGIPATWSDFRSSLVERFPAERAGIERYFSFVEQVDRVGRAGVERSSLGFALTVLKSPLILKYARSTAGQMIDSCIRDPKLRAILTARHFLSGVAPSRASSLTHGGLEAHYQVSGGWFPEGGAQALSDRLADEIEAAGSHVRLGAAARRIEVSGRRVTGVYFESRRLGERRVKTGHVVSNADVKHTIRDLVGADLFPRSFAERLLGFEMAQPLFTVFLGLDVPSERIGIGGGNHWLWGRLDHESEYDDLARGELPEDPTLYMSSDSFKGAGGAGDEPEEGSSLTLISLAPRQPEFWGVTAEEVRDGSYGRNPEYRRIKEEIADAVVERASALAPGLADHVKVREIATPLTVHRYVGVSDGAAYGFANLPDQFVRKRPGARTPLRGLHFCGMNCRSGHGVMGAVASAVDVADTLAGRGLRRRILAGRVPVSRRGAPDLPSA